jgi:hypothetical protein
MTDTDFERRLGELLAGYADRSVDTGAGWWRFTVRRRQAVAGRGRRLAVIAAAGAVAVAANVLPFALQHVRGERHSGPAAGGRRIAITARIGIPGPRHGPGDSGIVDAVGGQQGQVWAITYAGDLARIDPRTNRVTLRKHLAGLDDLTVGAGTVWALETGRLRRLDPATGRPTATFDLPRRCRAISFGGGQLWAACGDGGGTEFLRLDPSTGRVLASGGPAYGVSSISATADGIWYAGNSGVSGFVGTGSRLTWVNASDPADLTDTDSLVYADGSLWAFDGGEDVARISPATGRITKVYRAARYDPAGDLSLNFLAVDASSIWFLRDAGYRTTAVLRVSLDTGRPVGRVAGVGSCGQPCWQIYVAQGSAWVPSMTRLTRISPVTPPRRTGSR